MEIQKKMEELNFQEDRFAIYLLLLHWKFFYFFPFFLKQNGKSVFWEKKKIKKICKYNKVRKYFSLLCYLQITYLTTSKTMALTRVHKVEYIFTHTTVQ